jgi:two-component system, NarL family, sensor histidine kinase DesK
MTLPVEFEAAAGKASRVTLLLAGVWLVFMIEPVVSQWSRRDEASYLLAIVALLAFSATYLLALLEHVRYRSRMVLDMPLRRAYTYLAAMVALAVVMWIGLDQRGSGAVIYIAVVAAFALPTRHALVVVPLVAFSELAMTALVPGWEVDFYTPSIAAGAGFMMWGVKQVMARNIELVMVRTEKDRLVVEEERNRFARDLHDILGHSLTVIAVKTELANRLLDIDIERARSELEDLEMLARESLADVRRAVQGYREITLPGEIARARAALSAAGIEHELPNSADDVAATHRELFAWVIREGVTNVIKHSRAGICRVHMSATSVRVVDDGLGCETEGAGHGLTGLRERAAAIGATVHARNAEPGFVLEVVT